MNVVAERTDAPGMGMMGLHRAHRSSGYVLLWRGRTELTEVPGVGVNAVHNSQKFRVRVLPWKYHGYGSTRVWFCTYCGEYNLANFVVMMPQKKVQLRYGGSVAGGSLGLRISISSALTNYADLRNTWESTHPERSNAPTAFTRRATEYP